MRRHSLVALLLLALAAAASAQFGGRKREKPKSPVTKGDLKFIRCQVCEAMAKEARRMATDLVVAAGAKKVHEADMLDKIEKMCDPDQDDGDWIAQYDIVEQGTTLQLKDLGIVGRCKSECRTIARACEEIAEEIDLTDLSAMLYKGKKRAALTNWMCHESTDVCTKKVPPVPKDRPAGERHEPIDEDELKTIKMMRNMKANGMSGSMYSRDSMKEELAELNDEYSDDPDFAKAMRDTGLDTHVPRTDQEPASAADTVASAAGATATLLQETAAKATEAIKDGASKVMEGAKNFAKNLFGGSKKSEEGPEL